MIGMIANLVIPGYAKYIAIALLAAVAYWFVWDTGRGFERGRWERATVVELQRQQTILDAAQMASEIAAGLLLDSEAVRSKLVRRLSNEAANDTGADNACITPAGVVRLNSVGGEANTD